MKAEVVMIASFWTWFVDSKNFYTNIFTLLMVVLSGLISWFISAKYFAKGHRDNVKVSVLHPMKRILEKPYSWENYETLLKLSKEYSAIYLKENEQKLVENIIVAYRNVCTYNYERVCAECFFDCFKDILEKNGVNIKIVSIYIEGEMVDVAIPPELLYIEDDLARIINIYPPDYDEELCGEKVISAFKIYAKKFYGIETVRYFERCSFKDMLKKVHSWNGWNEKFDAMNNAKREFLNMKIFKS